MEIGIRKYVRLFNPVTNETTMILLTSSDGQPIGMLYTSPTTPVTEVDALLSAGRTQNIKNKQVEAYRQIFTEKAHISLHNKSPESVKAIQAEYMAKLELLANQPLEDNKNGIAKIKKIADVDFLKHLKNLKIANNFVQLSLFYPSEKLEKVRKEFLDKLNSK